MGVYFFAWKHEDRAGQRWIKVGHYKGTNPWSRCAHRGFSSCRPAVREMRGRTAAEDVDLLAWFPAMTRRQEGSIHRAHRAHRSGEWYPEALGLEILAALRAEQVDAVEDADKAAALATRRRL